MDEREKLARLIDPYSQGAPSNEAAEAADRILAAGYRLIPTEGPEWEAMIGQAFNAWWEHFDGPFVSMPNALRVLGNPIRAGLDIALRAALALPQAQESGE